MFMKNVLFSRIANAPVSKKKERNLAAWSKWVQRPLVGDDSHSHCFGPSPQNRPPQNTPSYLNIVYGYCYFRSTRVVLAKDLNEKAKIARVGTWEDWVKDPNHQQGLHLWREKAKKNQQGLSFFFFRPPSLLFSYHPFYQFLVWSLEPYFCARWTQAQVTTDCLAGCCSDLCQSMPKLK